MPLGYTAPSDEQANDVARKCRAEREAQAEMLKQQLYHSAGGAAKEAPEPQTVIDLRSRANVIRERLARDNESLTLITHLLSLFKD